MPSHKGSSRPERFPVLQLLVEYMVNYALAQ
jgi:hypothetical protein